MTTELDLVIRGGRIATAADVFDADIGIRGGRIVALGHELGAASEEIDATGKLVLPGGVDAHCHFDQPSSDGSVMADDFDSGPRSAAFGGTTTVIPFACQQKGQTLRAAVDDYHRRADGKSVIDYAFHLIVTDPTPQVLGQELPALIREGYTSFKIYTTYDDLKLNDRQIIEVLALAKREGALTMIHAENSDAIAWLTEALEHLLTLDQPPSVICCGNDEMAMRVYGLLRSRGLRVPEDISVAGYDDHRSIAEMLHPHLTTVELPYIDMGRHTAARLLDMIGGDVPASDDPLLVQGPVVWRSSVTALTEL